MMSEDSKNNTILARIENLHQQRKELLALEPHKALDRILNADEPTALVHSFSEQDLYFLIHDIGPDGALPILSLASDKQREYILDIETWHRDHIDISAVTRWFDLLCRADGPRTIRWLIDNKTEFLEYYLRYKVDIRIREHDQDPSEFGEGFFTFDNTFYIRLIEDTPAEEDEPSEAGREHYQRFLTRFVENLADFDHITYQKLLLESIHLIPAESEEEEFRLRSVRMAEKGFLPFDEAVGIYQPLKPKEIMGGTAKHVSPGDGDTYAPVPLYPSGLLDDDNLFTQAMTLIETEAASLQLQSEFAGLCNRLVAADHQMIRSKEDLAGVVKKACGYLNIGLQTMGAEREAGQPDPVNLYPAMIQRYSLSDIFRIGFGQALTLKWRARKWLDSAWFAGQGLSLTFWGEAWLGVLGGLLIKKPLFFDNYTSGSLYRDFQSAQDIRVSTQTLDDIMAFDNLLSLMDMQVKSLTSYRFLTYKNLLLTLWAGCQIGLTGDPQPLELGAFTGFFNTLWESGEGQRRIRPAIKASFLQWLTTTTGLRQDDLSENMAGRLEQLFAEVEDEYGRVAADDLDPRFIRLFLLEK